jgi:hypothetical protein
MLRQLLIRRRLPGQILGGKGRRSSPELGDQAVQYTQEFSGLSRMGGVSDLLRFWRLSCWGCDGG